MLYWNRHENNAHSYRDAYAGTTVFGMIGSGKSSGVGAHLARSMMLPRQLPNGEVEKIGGLVLTVAPGEADEWRTYGFQTGRKVTVVDEWSGHHFNPFQWYDSRSGDKGADVLNLVSMFMLLTRLGGRFLGASGDSGDAFWRLALAELLSNAMELLKLTGQSPSILGISSLVRQIPREYLYDTFPKLRDAIQKIEYRLEAAENGATTRAAEIQKLVQEEFITEDEAVYLTNDIVVLLAQVAENVMLTEAQRRTYEVVRDYFLSDMAALAENTRSSIVQMWSTYSRPLRSGLAAEFLSTTTSTAIIPECTLDEGEIIVLSFPTLKYGVAGLFIQSAYLSCWMAAVQERRGSDGNPVFLWIDECQQFVSKETTAFQAICRKSRCASIYLTQTVSGLRQALGGVEAAETFLGTTNTKIFCSSNSAATIRYAVETIGKASTLDSRGGVSEDGDELSEKLVDQITPQHIIRQRTGGPLQGDYTLEQRKKWDNTVQAIVTRGGRPFTSKNGLLKNFTQTSIGQQSEDYRMPQDESFRP